jgi:hypothetical protein
MIRVKIIIGAVLIALCVALPVAGQEIEFVSAALHYDLFWSVERYQDYVLCGGESSIQIFDISDSTNPVFIKKCDIPNAGDIIIEGQYSYVINRWIENAENSFRIFNITDSLDLIQVGMIDFSPERIHAFLKNDSLVFLCIDSPDDIPDPYSYFSVVNVADPANPVSIGSVNIPGEITDAYFDDDYVFITYSWDLIDNGLVIIDVTIPSMPIMAYNLEYLYLTFYSVAKYGNYIYISATTGDILVYNVSDPYNPTQLPTIDSILAYDIYIQDNTAFIFNIFGLSIYNISDSISFQNLGSYQDSLIYRDFLLSAETGFVIYGGDNSSLKIIDVSNVSNPLLINEYYVPDKSFGVIIKDDYAYVANGGLGLQIVDVIDVENPFRTGFVNTHSNANDIAVSGDYAYVIDRILGLYIINISDQYNPVISGQIPTQGIPNGVFVDGIYAYIAIHGGLEIIDVSDPVAPVSVGYFNGNSPAYNVFVSDNYAYLTCGQSGLKIIDVSDPADPFLITSAYSDYAVGISCCDNYAYIADISAGLIIYDISDPANPSFSGQCPTQDNARDVFISDNYAFVADSHFGIKVIDVADPSNPNIFAGHDTPGYSCEIQVEGDYVFVADVYSLLILYFDETAGTFEAINEIPGDFFLPQNYPNPFNASTTISYSLPKPADIRIEIFDILGRRAETLFSGPQRAGEHTVNWRPGDLSSGVYYYRIGSEDFGQSRSCLLIK